MAYPEDRRHKIHIVSSWVSAYMLLVMSHAKSAEKFARDWFHPRDGVEVHQVKSSSTLGFVTITGQSWSSNPTKYPIWILVTTPFTKLEDKHSEFLRWMLYLWQRLRGVKEYLVRDIININVFQQVGDNECGHLRICNIMLYLKVRWFHVLL